MKAVELTATRRTGTGKGVARQTRMTGNIPGVVYGPEIEPISVVVAEKDLRAAVKEASSISALFDLDVDGSKNKVIIREVQRDPVTSRVTHVDFHAISMTKPINVTVPINFTGTAFGVQSEGGILQTTLRELEISCLATDIPESIDVDVTELNIGDSIHVRDLDLGNVNILTDEQRTLVVVAAPTIVKEPEPEAEEGELLEGEEGAEGEGAEGAEGEAAEGDKKEEKSE